MPTQAQVRTTEGVVRWYLRTHYGGDDPGTPAMFADRERIGGFAVRPARRGARDDDLFRMLVAATMFQRRQDVQIMRILRSISPADVSELTSPKRLLDLVDESTCEHLRTTRALHETCDLSKHPLTKRGRCRANPKVDCHLKRHTVLLRRWGHFGKAPTSAALVLREANVGSLQELRDRILRVSKDPLERARLMEAELSKAYRVSSKIAAMFLSALCTPDIGGPRPPWQRGVDWTYFVVIDSNVDLYLAAIGYRGLRTYDARRDFIRSLAAKIDLSRLRDGLTPFNPRLVQQAIYLFMSVTNRRSIVRDCSHLGPIACRACPRKVSEICPLRRSRRGD